MTFATEQSALLLQPDNAPLAALLPVAAPLPLTPLAPPDPLCPPDPTFAPAVPADDAPPEPLTLVALLEHPPRPTTTSNNGARFWLTMISKSKAHAVPKSRYLDAISGFWHQ
jgi:hypothetical protein